MKKILYIVIPLSIAVLLSVIYWDGVAERIGRAIEEKRKAETNQSQKRIASFYASFESLIKLPKNPYFSERLQREADGLLKSGGSVWRLVVCSDDKPSSYEVKEIEGPTRFSVSARYEEDRQQVFYVRVIKSGGEWLIDEVNCLGER